MTPTEWQGLKPMVLGLWPRSRWGEAEWSVLYEQAARVEINTEQASAALRNLKASTDKYPTVALILGALRRAENRPSVGPASYLPREKPLPEVWRDENGLTSFELRCMDDPDFADFAHRMGRLPPERAAQVLGAQWSARPPTKREAKRAQIERRVELHAVTTNSTEATA